MFATSQGILSQPGFNTATPYTNTNSSEFHYRASTCVLLTITVACVCALALCGVMIVHEYTLSQHYEQARCRLLNVTEVDQAVVCQHCDHSAKSGKKGKDCQDTTFLCIALVVAYAKRGSTNEQRGQLHPDSIQATGENEKCSYEVCHKTKEENDEAVRSFARGWEEREPHQRPFDCFYNTADERKVIAEKKHSLSDVIHGMFWPSLVILLCGVVFLYLERRRRNYSLWGPSNSDVETAKKSQTAASNAKGKGSGSVGGSDGKETVLLLKSPKEGSKDGAKVAVKCELKSEGFGKDRKDFGNGRPSSSSSIDGNMTDGKASQTTVANSRREQNENINALCTRNQLPAKVNGKAHSETPI